MGALDQDLGEKLFRLNESTTLLELDSEFRRIIEAWGFNRWTALPVSAPQQRRVQEPHSFALGRQSAEWNQRYREKRYDKVDAIIRALRYSDEPIWWSQHLAQASLTREELIVFHEAKEFGIGDGLTAPIASADGSIWLCALTGPANKPSREVTFWAHQAMLIYVRRAIGIRRTRWDEAKPLLTKGQVRILELIAKGQKPKAAAEHLGIQVKTVYHQMQFAKERLSVRTTSELVARAFELGLIGTTF